MSLSFSIELNFLKNYKGDYWAFEGGCAGLQKALNRSNLCAAIF